MNQSPLSRRSVLGTVGSAALISVGVARPVSAATPAGPSPELLGLIAAARWAEQASDIHTRDVCDPAQARRKQAVAAVQATFPHTTVDAGESVMGNRIIWTTADPANVAVARFRVEAAKAGADLAPEHLAAARRLLAAHRWRERAISRARFGGGIKAVIAESNALVDANCEAEHAVADFPARTPADLALKLAFMVERRMGDGVDWLPELMADANRIAGEIA